MEGPIQSNQVISILCVITNVARNWRERELGKVCTYLHAVMYMIFPSSIRVTEQDTLSVPHNSGLVGCCVLPMLLYCFVCSATFIVCVVLVLFEQDLKHI